MVFNINIVFNPQEALKDLDEDGDQRISLNEFLGINHEYDTMDEEGENELEMLEREFESIRDKDGDGYLNKKEIKEWAMINETIFINNKVDFIFSDLDKNKVMKSNFNI